jgi:hypothetical protein
MPMDILNKIDFYFKMKPDLKGDPDMYLGSKIRKQVHDAKWSRSLDTVAE